MLQDHNDIKGSDFGKTNIWTHVRPLNPKRVQFNPISLNKHFSKVFPKKNCNACDVQDSFLFLKFEKVFIQ
jgi:hypothetical protein